MTDYQALEALHLGEPASAPANDDSTPAFRPHSLAMAFHNAGNTAGVSKLLGALAHHDKKEVEAA